MNVLTQSAIGRHQATVNSLVVDEAALARTCTHPWYADCGDGSYCNPVLHADYSDPDVVRVGDDFFLTASSFNCTPGLPILYSRDLVNWTIIGHALKNLPHSRYEAVQPGCGVWAPAIRFHAGKFWIFYPTPDEGIFVVTAHHPAGPWSEPHCVVAGKGLIDPCPLWDDDGQAYLVHAYAGSRAGIKHRLRVCPMSPDGTSLLGEGQIVFHQPEKHPTLEGPKFLKRDGWYYILAPAGGVEAGWQVALRSQNIYGPYEDKIVLAQGHTAINGPHQGALVDTADGGWWFIHFQDAGVGGRIAHLQPVHWRDGWPFMGHNGEPVARYRKPVATGFWERCVPQTSDEFCHPELAPQWQWYANHRADWLSLQARPGWLRLYPQPAQAQLNQQPNLVLQKLPARSFSVETVLSLHAKERGEAAGLAVVGRSSSALVLQYHGTGYSLILRVDDEIHSIAEIPEPTVKLRLVFSANGVCNFEFGGNSNMIPIPFCATKGTWIGAKVGLLATKRGENEKSGWADFDYFRFV